MTLGPLVLVEWDDAAGGHREGWRSLESMNPEPIRCRSVGWIRHRDDKKIIVVPHVSGDGDGDGEIVIPAAWARVIHLEERHE